MNLIEKYINILFYSFFMVSLKDALGNTPNVRVLAFLLDNPGDHSLSDIARGARVGWTTLHQLWPRLEELKLVVKTRTIGRAKLYTLNAKSTSIHHLKKLNEELRAEEAARETQNKGEQSRLV